MGRNPSATCPPCPRRRVAETDAPSTGWVSMSPPRRSYFEFSNARSPLSCSACIVLPGRMAPPGPHGSACAILSARRILPDPAGFSLPWVIRSLPKPAGSWRRWRLHRGLRIAHAFGCEFVARHPHRPHDFRHARARDAHALGDPSDGDQFVLSVHRQFLSTSCVYAAGCRKDLQASPMRPEGIRCENGGIMRERRWRGHIPDWDVSGWRRHTGGHEGHRSSAFMACPKSTSVKAIGHPGTGLKTLTAKKQLPPSGSQLTEKPENGGMKPFSTCGKGHR